MRWKPQVRVREGGPEKPSSRVGQGAPVRPLLQHDGDALVLNGRPKDAESAYARAVELDADDSYASARLALVYLTVGEREKADDLRGAFAKNARFADLASTLDIGAAGSEFLPSLSPDDLAHYVSVTVHSRPLVAASSVIRSRLRAGDGTWCAAEV